MFSVQHLQWIGIVVVAVGSLLMGGTSVLNGWTEYQRHLEGVQDLQRYTVLLDAANAVAAERGPANAAMGALDRDMPKQLEALEKKRGETDLALARVRQNFSSDIIADDGTDALEKLETQLRESRRRVDFATSRPHARRQPLSIAYAIFAMFAAADRAAELRNLVSGKLVLDAPELTGEVILANNASALREYEGRLGSFAVASLVSPPNRDPMYIQSMLVSEGIARSLWSSSVSIADKMLPSPKISQLIAAVQSDFFEGSLLVAKDAVQKHAADNSMSPGDLTAKYVPGLSSSEELRSTIVAQSISNLEQSAADELTKVVRSTVLTLAILAVLAVVALVFRKGLFSPLLRLHRDVLALASGDLREPIRQRAEAREVDAIFGGLDVLRERLAERRALELEQKRLNRQLRRLAETDTLTGLLNRRALLPRIDAMFRRADRHGEGLAIAVVDIDHFKAVNDTHGHAAGDQVLSGVARLLEGKLRAGDTIARIGGEEFVIVLRRATERDAHERLEGLRELLAETVVHDGLGLKVTASFGVAIREPRAGQEWDALLALADQRLYIAKASGRNRVVTSGQSLERRQTA